MIVIVFVIGYEMGIVTFISKNGAELVLNLAVLHGSSIMI